MKMTIDSAKTKLINEYPFLRQADIGIVKQFASPDGRISNTFLVLSKEKGFEKFVAKSFVHHPESLAKEWVVLNLLKENGIIAPSLLVAEHKPKDFLLLGYIEGTSATESLLEGYDETKIFKKIATTTGLINSIPLKKFGGILDDHNISWKDHMSSKVVGGLDTLHSFFDEQHFSEIKKFVHEKEYILTEEDTKQPMLVHHDIYLDNFLFNSLTNEMILIDYGMAFGGRPLFDLAKLFILALTKYPKQKDIFMDTYSKYVPIPKNFKDVISYYLVKECLGMIGFFDRTKQYRARDFAKLTLTNLVQKDGLITSLIS